MLVKSNKTPNAFKTRDAYKIIHLALTPLSMINKKLRSLELELDQSEASLEFIIKYSNPVYSLIKGICVLNVFNSNDNECD